MRERTLHQVFLLERGNREWEVAQEADSTER